MGDRDLVIVFESDLVFWIRDGNAIQWHRWYHPSVVQPLTLPFLACWAMWPFFFPFPTTQALGYIQS